MPYLVSEHSLDGSPSASYSFAGSPGSKARKQITRKIFTLSLKLAGEGEEAATSIASWCLSENVDCWKNWDNLYQENPEASVALLKKLLEEWKDLVLLPSDALALGQTMKSFMLRNKNAITGGRAKASLYKEADKSCKVISSRLSASLYKEDDKSCKVISSIVSASLYKEADKSCKVISSRLSRVRSTLKATTISAMVLVAVVILLAAGGHDLFAHSVFWFGLGWGFSVYGCSVLQKLKSYLLTYNPVNF
ncbi:PREDICTED: uncharacterized protein LOC104710115 [Camelina sativa]|uniref:Uncharacterized protein LOC104710115 n=1 Tax=Camelina sativa TaxID=90675 RepID=A0ABM0TDZ6_CAMSA|nr:PREDICTED: uncharacterized protein LOC104710115 [Camelina sativa]